MVDARITQLAKILVDYSTKVKKGEHVQISATTSAEPLVREVYRLVLERGAFPSLKLSFDEMTYDFYKHAKLEHLLHFPKHDYAEIKDTDVYIAIRGTENTRNLTNIESKKITLWQKTVRKIQEHRINKTRWVVTNYPTNGLAQEAGMSLTEFEDLLFAATNKDWEKEIAKMKKIKAAFDRGNIVRLLAPGTDLTLGLVGMKGMIGGGEKNMPDGEVFYSPNKHKTEGIVTFTYPAIRNGKLVEGIRLEFRDGGVVSAHADKNSDFLQEMLSVDDGARFLGEFGIGCNYGVTKYTTNLLFDEKIGGTIHLALGMAYKEIGETNKSAIHWDLVLDLRKGGEIYLDGKLVQKNGKWLL